MKHTLDNISNYFNLPITYNEKKMEVSDNIKTDLELLNAKNNESLYNTLFDNENECSKETSELWCKYYTHDKHFIQDTKKMLKKTYTPNLCELKCWNKIKGDDEFDDKYNFINFNSLKFLNESSIVLQILCFYKFISPLIALLYPIFMMLVPIIIMKYWNKINIGYYQYFSIIKMLIMNNSVIKLFTDFSLTNWRQTVYLMFSAFMYVFSIYQNVISCVNFHKNMKNINNYVIEMRMFIKEQIKSMECYENNCKNLSTYNPFLIKMNEHKSTLLHGLQIFDTIKTYSWDIHNLSHMGYSMKMLYYIYYNEQFHNSIMYSFGFNGYILNIQDIQNNIKRKIINPVNIGKVTRFSKAYYPVFKKTKHIKNDYSLKTNMIVSGPNASGKTTLIKTTLFNILISQQIGYGFYKKATIKLYKHIHSYLNIPDTSDRDSLFQAEARRCREIIESLTVNNNDNHFCIFDELYSGTNPYEANASAFAFIKFMLNKKIDFILTTHFVELCDNLDNEDEIKNYQMKIDVIDDKIIYLYKLITGVSKYKGGIHVLKQLNYPTEIIENTKLYLSK
tara:strand:+ start:2956 stop:4644 length:1689 start_codon:yes stop_codon:yes gene_type:complete